MNWIKKYPNTLQHDQSDCAAAVISSVLLVYKKELSIMKIREIIGTDMYGTTVKGIVDGLQKLHFEAKAVRVLLNEITKEVTLPVVLQVKNELGMNHFVVLHKIKNEKYTIGDPAKDVREYTFEDLEKIYQGIAIFMIPTSLFESTNKKDKSMFDLFKMLILPQKKLIITIILTSVLLSIIGIIASLFSKVIMDEIIPYQLKNSLYLFLIIFGIVSIIQSLLSAFRQQILLFLSRKIDIPVLMGYYNHIIHLPYMFFGTRRVGDIITRFQDAMTIKDIFTSISISLVMDITLSFISAIVLWHINSSLFIILLCMVFINIILLYVFKKPYKKINMEQMEAGSKLNSQLIESIKNINTIKAQNDEQNQIEKLEQNFVHSLQIGYKEGVLKNVQSTISSMIGTLGNIIFMAVGTLFIIDQKMSIGDLLVFQTLSQYFVEPVQNLVSLQLTFQEASIAMNRLNELMSLNREDENNYHLLDEIDLKEDILFEEVDFAYGSRPNVLSNFNLIIPKGKKIAIVGESGAGKSTIARLLLKFIEPSKGNIRFGEFSLNSVNQSYIRNKIAYIPQNIELFSGTILDNLKVGNPHAKLEDIIRVCKLVGIHDLIQGLQNKYGSFVEEGGQNFSGGEKQRLAIARALLSKADLYIFDEATSNLDSFSEQIIQSLIFDKIIDKTVIIIAHRLSTIQKCDTVCFMENGKVIEQGSHNDLLNQNGKYASMVRLQGLLPSNPSSHSIIKQESDEVSYG